MTNLRDTMITDEGLKHLAGLTSLEELDISGTRVTEKGIEALRKMTLLPARRLETSTAAARRKGRLQEGADADVVAFDPAVITDRATYRAPSEPSVGVRFLLVAGTLVVDGGRIVEGVAPGRGLTCDRGTPSR